MNALVDGILQQFESDDQDNCRHHKTGQILHPGVAVWMVLVRRLSGYARSDECDKRGYGVSHVVGSVSNHRNGIDCNAEYDFYNAQKAVGQNAQRSRKPGVSVPYFRVFVVFVILYEFSPEKFFHVNDPYSLYYISNK